MRVVGGVAKGKKLQGAVSRRVRPTTELVRGAIFNILREDDVRGARVLELFAGTGALGIEALSRGASWVDFVDNDWRQCTVIKNNLSSTGFSNKAQAHCKDVNRAMDSLTGPYDVILMDPPYELKNLGGFLKGLEQTSLYGMDTTLVVGHSKRQPLDSSYGRLVNFSGRRYGDSRVDFYCVENK